MKTGDSSNLNLLPSQAKFQAARMKLQATLKHYMSLIIIFWVAGVLIVTVLYFGSTFVLNFQNKKYDQALSSFKSLSQEIVINQLLKYRTKVVGQVLRDRFEYALAFERINSVFAGQARVSKFELNEDKSFMIEVSAVNKEGVDYIEDRAVDVNDGKVEGIKSIKINGASYKIDGLWTVSMEVVLI